MPKAGAAPPGYNWRHEKIRLKVGKNFYTMRTLSLMDAVEVEPLLGPLKVALADGSKPYTYAKLIMELAKALCPMILMHPDDIAAVDAQTIAAIIDFYGQQDWERVKLVRELRNDPGDEAEDAPGPGGERTVFYAVAAACAERSHMSVMEFLDQRLEFCMDALLALHDEYRRLKGAGKMPHGSFVQAMTSMMGGAKQYTHDTAPDWMKDLADIADKEREQG